MVIESKLFKTTRKSTEFLIHQGFTPIARTSEDSRWVLDCTQISEVAKFRKAKKNKEPEPEEGAV